MSITSILNGDEFWHLKSYIMVNVPKKDAFCSNTGYPAFSSDIPGRFVGTTVSKSQTVLIGELADYSFCLEILRYVKKDRIRNFSNFIRTIDSAYNRILKTDAEHSDTAKRYYPSLKAECLRYVFGCEITLRKVIEYASQLNKIENYHRIPHEKRCDFWDKFPDPCPKEVADDVVKLVEIFRESFFSSNVLTEQSTIVLHPCFGTHTSPTGIADLYADGILYDFKATKKHSYNWKHVGQVYGYYILHRLCVKYDKDTVLAEPVPIENVTGIALYYSQYGDIETCDLQSCNAVLTDKETEYIAKMMDQHRREERRAWCDNTKELFAKIKWQRMFNSRQSKESPGYTPENVGYAVGDTVYDGTQGRGSVLDFHFSDGCWYVVIIFASGRKIRADINKVILVNLDTLSTDEFFPDFSHYFHDA